MFLLSFWWEISLDYLFFNVKFLGLGLYLAVLRNDLGSMFRDQFLQYLGTLYDTGNQTCCMMQGKHSAPCTIRLMISSFFPLLFSFLVFGPHSEIFQELLLVLYSFGGIGKTI